MRFLVIFLGFSLGLSAHAYTNGQFAGPYGIIRVIATDPSGVGDNDGSVLYQAMDVPIQDSMMGPGKVIEGTDQALQFICAVRPQVGYECSIFIHQKGHGTVNMFKKTMQYKITGPEADDYVKLFKKDANGEFHFVSVDGVLKVEVRPQYFEVSFAQNSQPKIEMTSLLAIVQVEDTLKISHVQNFWDSLNYNNDIRKRFLGMAQALTALERHNPGMRFIYLVQEPGLVAGRTDRKFILNNGFPHGQFRTYAANSGAVDRLQKLNEIIDQLHAQKVILISHNGGVDPDVFHKLMLERRDVTFYPYFHIVYSTSSPSEVGTVLSSEQTGFVTSVELMVDWQLKQLTDKTAALDFAKSMIDRAIHEDPGAVKGELAFPEFLNCDDFLWRWPVENELSILIPLRDHLVNRCHLQVPLVGYSN